MTRKHYITVAAAMAMCRPKVADTFAYEQWIRSLGVLCNMFKSDNPRFQAEKFKEACHN